MGEANGIVYTLEKMGNGTDTCAAQERRLRVEYV